MFDVLLRMSPSDAAKLMRKTAAGLQLECSDMSIASAESIIADLDFAAKYISNIRDEHSARAKA